MTRLIFVALGFGALLNQAVALPQRHSHKHHKRVLEIYTSVVEDVQWEMVTATVTVDGPRPSKMRRVIFLFKFD